MPPGRAQSQVQLGEGVGVVKAAEAPGWCLWKFRRGGNPWWGGGEPQEEQEGRLLQGGLFKLGGK